MKTWEFNFLFKMYTVKPFLTHTPQWSPKMYGVHVVGWEGLLKIDSKNHKRKIGLLKMNSKPRR